MKNIKQILIHKKDLVSIMRGTLEKKIVLNKRATLFIKVSNHKNYLDDPNNQFIAIYYETK